MLEILRTNLCLTICQEFIWVFILYDMIWYDWTIQLVKIKEWTIQIYLLPHIFKSTLKQFHHEEEINVGTVERIKYIPEMLVRSQEGMLLVVMFLSLNPFMHEEINWEFEITLSLFISTIILGPLSINILCL